MRTVGAPAGRGGESGRRVGGRGRRRAVRNLVAGRRDDAHARRTGPHRGRRQSRPTTHVVPSGSLHRGAGRPAAVDRPVGRRRLRRDGIGRCGGGRGAARAIVGRKGGGGRVGPADRRRGRPLLSHPLDGRRRGRRVGRPGPAGGGRRRDVEPIRRGAAVPAVRNSVRRPAARRVHLSRPAARGGRLGGPCLAAGRSVAAGRVGRGAADPLGNRRSRGADRLGRRAPAKRSGQRGGRGRGRGVAVRHANRPAGPQPRRSGPAGPAGSRYAATTRRLGRSSISTTVPACRFRTPRRCGTRRRS